MRTVLIIEGDGALRRVVEAELRGEGYGVLTATNSGEGLELVERLAPDVIVVGPWPGGLAPGQLVAEVKRLTSAAVIGIRPPDGPPPADADALLLLPLGLDLLVSLVSQSIEGRLPGRTG